MRDYLDLRSEPLLAHADVPASGVVALCDFGAGATILSLADAGADFAPVGQPLRYEDFSGDLIDQEVFRTCWHFWKPCRGAQSQ